MGLLKIKDSRLASVTLVPDDFVDYYMSRSNGEFVKVYLYLLRCVHKDGPDPTVSSMADFFSCPEKDIMRALRHWEKAGLLRLNFTGRGKNEQTLETIELLPVTASLTATQNDPSAEETVSGPASGRTADGAEKPAQISTSRLNDLKSDEDARQILFATEQYLKRPLSATEMREILYFYDDLHFPSDLVLYLIEYCIEHQHTAIRYIVKTGLAWDQEGIHTLKAAKEYTGSFENKYLKIFKAFGIKNRNPIPHEKEIMDHWLNDYGFSMELISEAAARTIRKTSQPSFPYADRILSDWHAAGATTPEDVKRLDQKHQEEMSARKEGGSRQGSSASAARTDSRNGRKNSFNSNFSQREYNYDDLEKALLDSQDNRSSVNGSDE